MGNLIRETFTTPGDPGTPDQPCYFTYEDEWVFVPPMPMPSLIDLYRSGLQMLAAAWNGAQQRAGVTFSGSSTITQTSGWMKVTRAKWNPGIPGTPAVLPTTAWDAFGHSISEFRRCGEISFSVPPETVSAVVGLSTELEPVIGYSHIRFAVGVRSGKAYHLDSGTELGEVPVGKIVKVRFTGTTAIYFIDDVEVFTAPAQTNTPEVFHLSAALYAVNDQIASPFMGPLVETGSAYGDIEPLMGQAADGPGGWGVSRMAPMRSEGGNLPAADGKLAPLTGYAADADGGSAAGGLPPLESVAFNVSFPPVSESRASFGGITSTSLLVVGQNGSADGGLRGVFGFSAETDFGQAIGEFEPITGLAFDSDDNDVIGAVWLDFGFEALDEAADDLEVRVQLSVAFDAEVETVAVLDLGVTLDIQWADEAAADADFAVAVSVQMAFDSVSEEMAALDAAVAMQVLFDVVLVSPGGQPDTDAEVWAMNLSGAGSTRYMGYPFNSFAQIGGRYFGAADDGIFELNGDTDAGRPIPARIDLGRLVFDRSQKKTVAAAYVAMAAAQPLRLHVDAEGAVYTYATRSAAPQMQPQRVTLGKGLKTSYVALQLLNTNGADFEVDGLELVIADLSRRI